MRYWVYINDKVEGPFDEDNLVMLQGFTPDTLICSEDTANSGNQEWVKASSVFEFDQPAPVAAQPQEAASAADGNFAAQENLASILLAKLDILTNQISGLQNKLDGMQTKLDGVQTKLEDAITAQKAAPAEAVTAPTPTPIMDDSHANTITLTRHDIEAQVEEVLPPGDQSEKPLDMLNTVELGDHTSDGFSSKAGEDVVVSAALDSLYNAELQNQAQKDLESTFQDLLTPKQVADLTKTAQSALAKNEEQERTLTDALKKVEQEANDPTAKDKLIDSFSTAPQQDVVDQLIQEKEEEKENKAAVSGIGLAAAGAAAALAGAAAAGAFADNKEEQSKPQPFDFNQDPADIPALSIAGNETAAAEEPAQGDAAPAANEPDLASLDAIPNAQEPNLPSNEPEQNDQAQPADNGSAAVNNSDIPSLDAADHPLDNASGEQNPADTQSALEELVPGAKLDSREDLIITEQDIKEAFMEHKEPEESVSQMFGFSNEETQPADSEQPKENAAKEDSSSTDIPVLETQDAAAEENKPAEGTSTKAEPANPNELTEIELKEGSTYLISDFVPPAQAAPAGEEQKNDEKTFTNTSTDTSSAASSSEGETEVQEMVGLKTQTEKPVAKPENAPEDVTVSQVILENTIRTKRGASLDIKTVPMVPEPGESQRLHLEGMDDDLNTQHDLQQADVKPASKTIKVVVFSLLFLLLLAIFYGVLAFLNLLPAQFNVLAAKKEAAQQLKQTAQLEEMLPSQNESAASAGQAALTDANPEQAILEEVKNYSLANGDSLQGLIAKKHAGMQELISWEIATAVDPDNYSILVKIPPENPQGYKISYRFNYNALTKELEPTTSDAKNLLDTASNQGLTSSPVAMQ